MKLIGSPVDVQDRRVAHKGVEFQLALIRACWRRCRILDLRNAATRKSKLHSSEALLAQFCMGKPVVADCETTVATHCKHPGSHHCNYSKMNSTTIEEQNGKGGSIAVYQRLLPGRRPAKVEVIRATYETIRASNGKTFGRTNNTVLLRIPSGTTLLSSKDYTKLREVGLNEKQIVYVNGRLNSLAGPAQARTHEMDIVDAQAKLTSFASLLELTPSLAKDLRAVLVGALRDIDERIEVDGGPAGSGEESPTELLKNTLALLNQTCVRAQALYKQLPKGELPYDVVLEFQRSWFLHADMVSTFRNRKCFSRPAGWTGLRTQVLDGRIYKCGDPVSEGLRSSGSGAAQIS